MLILLSCLPFNYRYHNACVVCTMQFVSILRGHSSVLPTTVIIGCSANAEMYISDFLEAGADAVWKKPMPVIHAEICKYIVTRSKYSDNRLV
jgi:hypothetical protein